MVEIMCTYMKESSLQVFAATLKKLSAEGTSKVVYSSLNSKHNVVIDSIMMLCIRNQGLCNVWSYDFYRMTLATES